MSTRQKPRRKATERGKPLARGKATQFVIYPRPTAMAVIAQQAQEMGMRTSNFCVLAALEKVARARKCDVPDLLPPDDYAELCRLRGRAAG